MRNQAQSRGGMNGDRRDDQGQYDADDGWTADGYELRPGHHAAEQAEQEYDPRAYAPNPDEPYGYDDDGQPIYYEPEMRAQRSGSRGGMVMVAAVLAIAAIGGAGAVGYKMIGGGSSSGEAPLIRADTEPVKTTPDRSNETAQQNKAIYDRVDPANSQKSKVVSREEQPVDLPSAPSSEPRGDGSRIILPGGVPSNETTPPDTQGGEPRRVKTVAIKPDAAAEPQKPAPQPPVSDPIAEAARTGQAPRSGEFDNGILSDGAPAPRSGANAAASRPAVTPTPRPAVPAAPVPQPQTQQAARVPAPQAAPAPAPARPAPTPAPAQTRADPQQVAALPPRGPAAAPATRPAAGGGFVVQVTSQRSEADARAAYANLQKRFPQVLSPYQASIQSADVGDRGTYYRVRVGPFSSSSDASTVCNNLRAAGGDCVVSRN